MPRMPIGNLTVDLTSETLVADLAVLLIKHSYCAFGQP